MDFEQKVKALQEMKREVGEEMARRLCEILDLANKAGVSIIDARNPSYYITDFEYDPDTDRIGFAWEEE